MPSDDVKRFRIFLEERRIKKPEERVAGEMVKLAGRLLTEN